MHILNGWSGSGKPKDFPFSPDFQVDIELPFEEATANWLCLWPARAAHLSSAVLLNLFELSAWSSVYLCAFILHVAPATTLSVLISFLKVSLLSFWPFGALLPAALDLSGTLGVAGKNDAVKCQTKSRWNCMHVWVTSSLLHLMSLIE